MKIIDVHSHFVCPGYAEYLRKHNKENEDGFPTPKWSIEKHLDYMKKVGIEKCVLSLSSPHFYCESEKEMLTLAKEIDTYASNCKKEYPKSFLFASSLPVPYIDMSIDYVDYVYDVLGADAIKLPSNANGMYLGDVRYEPLYKKLNEREGIIFVHPTAPQSYPKDCFTSEVLPLFEFIADTTRSIIDLIVSGMLEKYSNIKFIIPHCGSFLPNVVNRIEGITKALGNCVCVQKSLQSFYFDIAGDSSQIKNLLTLTDEDHILFGGDFPYTPVAQIEEKVNSVLKNKEYVSIMDKIMYKNAEKLLLGYKKNKNQKNIDFI